MLVGVFFIVKCCCCKKDPESPVPDDNLDIDETRTKEGNTRPVQVGNNTRPAKDNTEP